MRGLKRRGHIPDEEFVTDEGAPPPLPPPCDRFVKDGENAIKRVRGKRGTVSYVRDL